MKLKHNDLLKTQTYQKKKKKGYKIAKFTTSIKNSGQAVLPET